MTVSDQRPQKELVTTPTNTDDRIAAHVRDVVSAGGNQEQITDLLGEDDLAAVAEASLKLLLRLGAVARANDVDVDVLLAGKPRSGRDRLADRLRSRSGDSYQQGAPA